MIQYTKAYIGQLLDKFMEGTSTLGEEDILSQYFSQNQTPTEWEQYRLLFAELEAMKPTAKPKRRWIPWSASAAVVAGVIYMVIPTSQTDQPNQSLVAEADTTTQIRTEKTPSFMRQDTATLQHMERNTPVHQEKRRMRKTEPTIHDYAKAYTLMAEAEQERRNVEQQIANCQQELIEAQLAAYGYVPVMQEDGSILYMNEQTEYIAYEE